MSFGVCSPLGNHETSSRIIHFFTLMHIKKSAPPLQIIIILWLLSGPQGTEQSKYIQMLIAVTAGGSLHPPGCYTSLAGRY